MNTDDTGSGRTPDDEPVVIGAGLRDVEDRLRTSLRADADSIQPTDRLSAILGAAHDGVGLTSDEAQHRRRWLMPAAAAAAAAVVGGALWLSGGPSGAPVPPASTASTSSTVSQPPSSAPTSLPSSGASSGLSSGPVSTGPVTEGTPPATTTPPPVAVTVPTSVPVYYVGPRVPGGTDLALFREFVLAPVAKPVTGEGKALAALRLATAAAPEGSGYQAWWTGVEVPSVSVTASRITVTLSTGLTGVSAEQSKLAVQQLVWTAQGAVGEGLMPVSFTLTDGSTDVAPGLPASASYTQPTGQAAFSEISMIWISGPTRGAALKAGPVTVSGVASIFEATVQWQVVKGGSVVASGVA
ncbi:MAG: Gmad2 immunoglobulin-like domain-containing protein, partial [Dermatophilaceae bacterium]